MRDASLDNTALRAGWTVDEIKRTRVSDLRKILNLRCEKKGHISKPPPHRFEVSNLPLDARIPVKIGHTPIKPTAAEPERTTQDAPIGVGGGKLSLTETFENAGGCIGDVHKFFEDICDEYVNMHETLIRRHGTLMDLAGELDDEEKKIARECGVLDRRNVQRLQMKVQGSYEELCRIISQKLKVLSLLKRCFDDSSTLISTITGRLQKLQMIQLAMKEKLGEWRITVPEWDFIDNE